MSFVKDPLQSSDEAAPFIKLSVTQKFYCQFLENLKTHVLSVNATGLKDKLLKDFNLYQNLLKFNRNLEATSVNKEFFISLKDGLGATLQYSREYSSQNNATHLSRAAYIIRNEILEKD